ncbi:hypothetical protein B0H16DRAFT_1541060 [Mycena metata]|uniref:Uncharacterized protein n=1 Tax=Mycena metata TaxID=1033252 RepID=A0AAD7NCK9_9AGAR|nr:hypothetical protein B0H16DRAFT_1541060 [Mycena metata]
MDFSSVLRQSPLLRDLTLNIDGTCIPVHTGTSYLCRLRSFTGSVQNCAAISSYARALTHLTILFPEHRRHDMQNRLGSDPPIPFTLALFPRNTNRAVTSLEVRAIGWKGLTGRYPSLLCPQTLRCLAGAFPNLTHLDVSLSKKLCHYHSVFAALPALQHLSVRVFELMREQDYWRPPATIFPAEEYETQLNEDLSSHLHLTKVYILLWGKRTETYLSGCESCDRDAAPPPDWLIEYRFGRAEGRFALLEMTATTGSEWAIDMSESVAALSRVRQTFARTGWI